MIQRIQTLFLFGVILMLTIASFSGNFFDYVTNEAIFHFNGFGISKYTLDGSVLIEQNSIPLYIIPMALALFALFVMLSYKKINKQYGYSKILWGLYLLLLIGVVVWNYFLAPDQIKGEVVQNNYGAAFYYLVIGLPLTHLAFMNIGKDKKKLDSLNRLR